MKRLSLPLNELDNTDPAMEIILSKKGRFSLKSGKHKFSNLSFAVVQSNISHSVEAIDCEVELLMIECDMAAINSFLFDHNIELNNGLFTRTEIKNPQEFVAIVKKFAKSNSVNQKTEFRIQKCLNYFSNSELVYDQMLVELTDLVNLSGSRISHLFKDQMGISIKKYLVWSRLKRALELVLINKISLYQAANESGFHDQAHFSKAFRQMLGLSPSEVYNSRIIQI